MGRFGLKTGINFAHFGVESGMVFGGTHGSVWMYLSFQFQMSKKERNMRIRNGFDKFVCLRSNLSNHNITSA